MKPLDAQMGKVAEAAGMRARLAHAQRARLATAFAEFMQEGQGGSVLQVGLRGVASAPLQTAAGLLAPAVACTLEPGLPANGRFARADGRQLAYADGEFDWVFGENLLDHAGSFERQLKLLVELNRVARKGIFITAANRRHPLDSASLAPLLHWLPAPLWQRVAPGLARGRRLLTSQELKHLASLLPGQPHSDIGHIRLGGPKAVFFLMVKK